ncbi:response regulator [Candidatus Saccharibacteria bacterium]|nr:response regulator [Candidatus Saccharibacteria bacterium]
MRVLLVEPDVLLGRSYGEALTQDKHTVDHVRTAQDAVQAADAHKPDVVVVNIDMPRHNGVEFLYEFTSYNEWQGTPVLVLASQLNHDLAERTVVRDQLGVREVLVRSRTGLQDLCRAVRAVGQADESA